MPDALFGCLLFGLSLLPRAWVALRWAREPVWDGHYYDFGARRIAEGMGYSDDLVINGQTIWHPWCHYPVGYSAFLGAFYRIFGADLRVTALVNATIGAALAVVTWLLATHIYDGFRARLAGALVALHPGLIVYSALVMTEPLAALATLIAFLAAVRLPRPWAFIVAAILLGLSALVRPQALLCAPFFFFVADGSIKKRIAGAAIALGVALLVVMPWTIRNCRTMDGCALVSTNGGWNLAIGSFPRATGRFETLHSSDGCAEVTGQVQQDRCWFAYGIDHIRAQPGRWLALIPKKLAYTFDHESFAVEYLHEAQPTAWPEEKRANARALTTWFHRFLVCAAPFFGIAFVRRGRLAMTQGITLACVLLIAAFSFAADPPVFWPLALTAMILPFLPIKGRPAIAPAMKLCLGLALTTALTHAVFFGEDRYHIVVVPVLSILAAGALRTYSREPA